MAEDTEAKSSPPMIHDATVMDFEEWRQDFLQKYGKEPTRHDTWQEATIRSQPMTDQPSKDSLEQASVEILRVHEHPKTTEHYRTGPHEKCFCRVCVLQRQNAALVSALRRIANPIASIADDARKQGTKMDGVMAINLASDPEYLKEIARTALAPYAPAEEKEKP